jgi:hypothetical protein
MQFQDIKRVCASISKLNANDLAKQFGRSISGEGDPEADLMISREDELEELLKKRGLIAACGPITSGAYDEHGKWIDFVSLTQVFTKEAPILKALLNEVSRHFSIQIETNDRTKVGGVNEVRLMVGAYDEECGDLIDNANYFLTSERTCAFDLTNMKIIEINGCQAGGAGQGESGASIELNVENGLDANAIIHELVHLKWPEDIPQTEHDITEVATQVTQQLVRQGFDGFLKDEKVEAERQEALNAFALFDTDLRKFIQRV